MPYTQETVNIKAIFQSLVEALELSDPYTRGHSDRVSMLSVALGLDLGLSSSELEILKDAGVLHDIGKIGISKDVLNKPGRLSDEEFMLIKQHVTFGYNILKPLNIPELLEITLLHHERIDGRGYPEGRTEYPLLVKVLQIADVWDALTSDRPYRGAMPITKARDLMGTADNNFGFEPSLLETFLRLTRFIFPDDDCQPDEMAQILNEFEDLGVLEDLTPIK